MSQRCKELKRGDLGLIMHITLRSLQRSDAGTLCVLNQLLNHFYVISISARSPINMK